MIEEWLNFAGNVHLAFLQLDFYADEVVVYFEFEKEKKIKQKKKKKHGTFVILREINFSYFKKGKYCNFAISNNCEFCFREFLALPNFTNSSKIQRL